MSTNKAKPDAKKVFISHSHREPQVAAAFDNLVTTAIEGLRDQDVRRTSAPETGLEPGSYITPELIEDIRNCRIFVGLVSQNYLRSPYCLMEYAAWLGAHPGVPPTPLKFPDVEPDDMAGMLKGVKLVEIEAENELLNVLELIAGHGRSEGWTLRDTEKFDPQLQALIKAVKKNRPRRFDIERLISRHVGADFLNAYGLDLSLRTDGIFQDFFTTKRPSPVQFLWTDPSSDSSIQARWYRKNKLLRVSFQRPRMTIACNVSIRPLDGKAVLRGERRKLCIRARVGEGSELDEIGLLIRLVNGYMQHWRLAQDQDNRKHLIVRGRRYQNLCVDLDAEKWTLFEMDGVGSRGPSDKDFNILASLNLDLGRAQTGGRGDVREGNGVLDLTRIWLE